MACAEKTCRGREGDAGVSARKLSPEGMHTDLEALLRRDGSLVCRPRGVSMEPMLRQNRDLVVIRLPVSRLKKYDVALYRQGDECVLHRVIGVEKDHYRIRGDHTYTVEHVPDRDVIGVLTAFRRKGKEITPQSPGYILYTRLWHALYPFRALCHFLRRKTVSAARRMGLLSPIRRLLRRSRPS